MDYLNRSTSRFKKHMLHFILTVLIILTAGCVRLYRPQTPDELTALNLPIVSLPDSCLTIPEFNGKDTVVIFSESSYGYTYTKKLELYNTGLLVPRDDMQGQNISRTRHVDLDSFRILISELNKLGYFSITNENIEKKKWIEYRGCCLGILFTFGPRTLYNDFNDLNLEFHLKGIDHRLHITNDLLSHNYIKDVIILKTCIDIINTFLYTHSSRAP